ncbi:MAG: Crossover junction endodeoxyribonuclease RuvC [Candidatus Woesebacteria bacterium GW2011_GWB1_38_5b]|uniref:Crossover junction endodeoxyribonuclease RuvC n=2 Tax=Candidatus Woeseibacteriota TaxID=1752722 RepID=A0A0G0K877_9BACT|nr:MAG: Crossover junction endodeoxyribonuclease RuvC [Candidatus Woesebacteria bacterium GW2011_GWB1_38_5b]OGM19816.1 MAG: crossover junction endodeoxyribonuclease RuvC [Candidatus Woesebacteria bacterium RIFCSPHIGHO2_01_FULL_38_10]OGM59466.1 MAG: crossover junction endodeoxyribonuclease RuvC [Candidatus Woesebacteria bacterium RIFCSPLOWO2_01_FULL_39_10b]
MIILGIDPGTATTGYGLLQIRNNDLHVIDFGLIETDKNGTPELRLLSIHEKMTELFIKYTPHVVAIEKLFFAANTKTAMRVGQAQGVMFLCAAQYKVKIFEYAPATIKKVVSGNGRADKKNMQKSIRKILGAGIRSKPKKKSHFDNAADALAVALTHAIQIKKVLF